MAHASVHEQRRVRRHLTRSPRLHAQYTQQQQPRGRTSSCTTARSAVRAWPASRRDLSHSAVACIAHARRSSSTRWDHLEPSGARVAHAHACVCVSEADTNLDEGVRLLMGRPVSSAASLQQMPPGRFPPSTLAIPIRYRLGLGGDARAREQEALVEWVQRGRRFLRFVKSGAIQALRVMQRWRRGYHRHGHVRLLQRQGAAGVHDQLGDRHGLVSQAPAQPARKLPLQPRRRLRIAQARLARASTPTHAHTEDASASTCAPLGHTCSMYLDGAVGAVHGVGQGGF
jgi:hypothetical protein